MVWEMDSRTRLSHWPCHVLLMGREEGRSHILRPLSSKESCDVFFCHLSPFSHLATLSLLVVVYVPSYQLVFQTSLLPQDLCFESPPVSFLVVRVLPSSIHLDQRLKFGSLFHAILLESAHQMDLLQVVKSVPDIGISLVGTISFASFSVCNLLTASTRAASKYTF